MGLNHHRETVVFGGALLYDETIEFFVWLFETFLEVMFEKKPITIFTDQDAAMSAAIKKSCLRHIMHCVVGICDRMLRNTWVIYSKVSLNLMMIS